MVVGCLEILLGIDAADSLKEKRSVVKRLLDRLQGRFNASAAEVGSNDDHRRALIGIVTVGNDGAFVNSVLDKIIDFVEDDALGRAEIVDTRIEILHVSGSHEDVRRPR